MENISKSEFTDNIYSRLLVFYHNQYPDKLNKEDLNKIVKKYTSKPSDILLRDLNKKYGNIIPSNALLSEVSRICCLCDIPTEFISLLPIVSSEFTYNKTCDPRTISFDAHICLTNKKMFISSKKSHPIDNISKLKLLLSNPLIPHLDLISQMKKSRTDEIIENKPPVDFNPNVNQHILDQIATISKPQTSESNSLRHPMDFLNRLVASKIKARIHIRYHDYLRGYIDGEIICFDKHFNLVIKNAQEEYILPKEFSNELNQGPKLKRFLPQTFVRGDNIVLISSQN